MYWLMCVMHIQKMKKLDKILCNPSVEKHKTMMQNLHRDDSGESKSN